MNSSVSTTVASGKERRQYVRHPVSFPVTINIQNVGQLSATACDFCQGGLLLEFSETLSSSDTSQMNGNLCLITIHLGRDDYRLRASIAHADNDSTGIAFINPDQIALEAIIAYTKINLQQSKLDKSREEHNKQSTYNKNQVIEIFKSCNQIVQESLSKTIRSIIQAIQETLFTYAKDSEDTTSQNSYFKATEQFTNDEYLFINAFSQHVNHVLLDILNLNFKKVLHEDDMDPDSLALISDDDFNTWLANSKVITKVESEFSQILGEIETRLSYVYGELIERSNNPYNPSLYVHAFEKAINSLDIKTDIIPAFYEALKVSLMSNAPKVLNDINEFLINQEILPTSKAMLAEARRLKQHYYPDSAQDEKPGADDQDKQPAEITDVTNNNHQHSAEKVVAVEGNEIIDSSETHKTEELVSIDKQNLYDLVGQIRNLQEQVHSHNATPDSTIVHRVKGKPQKRVIKSQPQYNNTEVIELASKLQSPLSNVTGDGVTLCEFRQSLANVFSESESGKSISTKQNQVLDTTENVFAALLADMQVANSVRPWIEKLALPILKMSLLDESILTNKEHIVRDVINKISELEVLASADDQEEQAAVNQAFNWIVNLINQEFDGTTNAYVRAARQLDILISVQQQAFEKNIKQVIEQAAKEESLYEILPEEDEPEKLLEDDEERWHKMVLRLLEGHWVLFDSFSDEPKRLKVAWIAPRKGKYVFVNVMGRKDRILTDIDLAKMFKTSEAIPLDCSEDPAMDRAQYSMLQNLHKQLLYQSTHDELTGLVNRREFITGMQHALDDAVVTNNKHAVCYMDLDNFKIINDSYGFDAGDELIKQFVSIVKENIDVDNILARIQADTIAILIQNVSTDDAIEAIEDIQDQLTDFRFEWQGNSVAVSMSTGIAIINKSTGNVSELFTAAEASCNQAKSLGGNQIQIHHAGSGRKTKRKQESEWVTRIDKVIDENQLHLRCQRIHPIQQHVFGQPHYEILLGLPEHVLGDSNLQTFIQAAEHYNKMINIDRWVIRNAFNWLANNEDIVSDITAFTINLSGQSLNSDHLVDYINEQITQTTVPIERICFEITETAGVNKLSDAANFIETIKLTGCQFALDDFGSGMSSYSYLKNLPVDYLKIDGVFVKEITSNQNDFAVVKSITEIAHFMEKTVIAEFVQDDAAVKLLTEIGVDYAQGYGIEKPKMLDELLSEN